MRGLLGGGWNILLFPRGLHGIVLPRDQRRTGNVGQTWLTCRGQAVLGKVDHPSLTEIPQRPYTGLWI